MSVSFQRQMQKIIQGTDDKARRLLDNIDAHVGRSIMYGSPVTGAPGQPVDKGELLESWVRLKRGKFAVAWISRKFYAPIIEDNWREAQLRSKVGGFHSVKMTRHGFPALVRYELALMEPSVLRGPLRDARGRFTKAPE
jgi:hypothetical protein